MPKSLRVIGIDLGEVNIGFSVLNITPTKAAYPFNVLTTDTLIIHEASLSHKCITVHSYIKKLLEEYKPSSIYMERTIMPSKPGSSMDVLAGAIYLTAALYSLDCHYLRPNQVKKIVSGNGRSSKSDIKAALSRWLKVVPEFATSHESDAVAVGIAGTVKDGLVIISP